MVAQRDDLIGEVVVVGDHRAGFAPSPQVLPGVKAETGADAETPGAPPLLSAQHPRPVRLARILDEVQAMFSRQCAQGIDGGGRSIEMDRENCLRSVGGAK